MIRMGEDDDHSNQLRLVLFIDQGRNFLQKHVEPLLSSSKEKVCLLLSASLMSSTIETRVLPFEEAPVIKEELIFSTTRNELESLRAQSQHLHVKVFALNSRMERHLVGAFAFRLNRVLSSIFTNVVVDNEDIANDEDEDEMSKSYYRCKWYTLKNMIHPMAPPDSPQLLTSLCVERSHRGLKAKYDARGFFVVGQLEEATHVFQFCLERIIAQNLHLVLPQSYSRPEGVGFKLAFDFFGIWVESMVFSNLKDPDVPADSACAKIVSNAMNIADFFNNDFEPVVFRLIEIFNGEETEVASTHLDIRQVLMVDASSILNQPTSVEQMVFFNESFNEDSKDKKRTKSVSSIEREAFIGTSLELEMKRIFKPQHVSRNESGKTDEVDCQKARVRNDDQDSIPIASLRRQVQVLQSQLVKKDISHRKEVCGLKLMMEKLRAELLTEIEMGKSRKEEVDERERTLDQKERELNMKHVNFTRREDEMKVEMETLKRKISSLDDQLRELHDVNESLRKRMRPSSVSHACSNVSPRSNVDWSPNSGKRQRLKFLLTQRSCMLKTRCYSPSDPVIQRLDQSISMIENSLCELDFEAQ